MAGPKPFMVCSISTKWHGPKTYKTPVRKLSWAPLGTSTGERSSNPRRDPTKQTSRPGCSPAVAPKVDPRRPLPKSTPRRLSDRTIKDQKSLPLSVVPSRDRSLSKKTVVPKPLKIMARWKEGKVIAGSLQSLPVTSTRVTTAKQLPLRPSCVPPIPTPRPAIGIKAASSQKRRDPRGVSTISPCYLGASQKQSINVGMTKTAGRVRVAETFRKPMVSGSCRTGVPNRKMTAPLGATACPHATESPFHVAWSPQESESSDLSFFPPQSWKIILDVDVQHVKGPTKTCGDETLSNVGGMLNSGVVAGATKGSCGCSKPDSDSDSDSIPSRPELSPSSTVVETPQSLAGGLDIVKISIPTEGPSNKPSHLGCDATTILRSGDGISVGSGSQTSLLTDFSPDTINNTRMVVCRAVENARAFFSPSRRELHCGTSTEATTTSRLRKLFIGPLHEDTKNPTTEIESEIFRARRQVDGDSGAVDSRLYQLGSIAAMAIVMMVRASVSNSPDRV